jgi:hypothetical protein
MIDDLCKAIKVRYDSASGATLRAALTGGLWFVQAEQGVSAPYATYTWLGSTPHDYMGTGTTSKFEIAEIRFDIFSEDEDGGTILTGIIDSLQSLFDWCSLSITGYTHIAFERIGTSGIEVVDDVWRGTVNYRAWFNG